MYFFHCELFFCMEIFIERNRSWKTELRWIIDEVCEEIDGIFLFRIRGITNSVVGQENGTESGGLLIDWVLHDENRAVSLKSYSDITKTRWKRNICHRKEVLFEGSERSWSTLSSIEEIMSKLRLMKPSKFVVLICGFSSIKKTFSNFWCIGTEQLRKSLHSISTKIKMTQWSHVFCRRKYFYAK